MLAYTIQNLLTEAGLDDPIHKFVAAFPGKDELNRVLREEGIAIFSIAMWYD